MDPPPAGASRQARQAEQWMRVAEKLLMAKDLEGCKEFSSQALAADSRTPGAEDLHAAADVLLAAQRRRLPNGQPDPYAVLGLDPAIPASRHPDAVHSSYRRLSLLLNRSHPDRPSSASVAEAARLVADAWAFLSNPGLKSALHAELDAAAPPRAPAPMQQHLPQPSPSPHPQQSTVVAARQPLSPPRPSPLRAAPQPPARAAAPPPPLPQQSPTWAAPQQRPPPQQRPIPAAHQQSPLPAEPQPPLPQQPSPLRADPPTPAAAAAQPVESGTSSPAFWTLCKVCSHIHQYDRLYEARKLKCSSCHQPFVAEAMAEIPPIVPGTDMYYCTWGFFPIGFPGCPGFESLVNKQPQGQDQLNAPWLGANGGMEDSGGAGVQNGTPISAAIELPVVLEPAPEPLVRMRVEVPTAPEPVMPRRVEVPAAPKPVKTMRVNSFKVGAKKRGRPKGSKNKKKAMT